MVSFHQQTTGRLMRIPSICSWPNVFSYQTIQNLHLSKLVITCNYSLFGGQVWYILIRHLNNNRVQQGPTGRSPAQKKYRNEKNQDAPGMGHTLNMGPKPKRITAEAEAAMPKPDWRFRGEFWMEETDVLGCQHVYKKLMFTIKTIVTHLKRLLKKPMKHCKSFFWNGFKWHMFWFKHHQDIKKKVLRLYWCLNRGMFLFVFWWVC